MSRFLRGCFLTGSLFLVFSARDARADWLLTPFIGSTFAGQTTLVQLDQGAVNAKHWVFGGSAGWLSDNVLGLEAEIGFVPGMFVKENPDNLITANSVTALTGNVIAAVPLSVTRDSLRPYLIGGIGLVHAVQKDRIGLLGFSVTEPALQLGGGAIGLVSDRTGLRFDLRQLRSLSRDATLTGDRRAKLSFWRATVGVVIRY